MAVLRPAAAAARTDPPAVGDQDRLGPTTIATADGTRHETPARQRPRWPPGASAIGQGSAPKEASPVYRARGGAPLRRFPSHGTKELRSEHGRRTTLSIGFIENSAEHSRGRFVSGPEPAFDARAGPSKSGPPGVASLSPVQRRAGNDRQSGEPA